MLASYKRYQQFSGLWHDSPSAERARVEIRIECRGFHVSIWCTVSKWIVQNGSAFDVTIEGLKIGRRFYFLGQLWINRVCAYVLGCCHKQVSLNFSGFDRGCLFYCGNGTKLANLWRECEFRGKRVGLHTEFAFLVMAASLFWGAPRVVSAPIDAALP